MKDRELEARRQIVEILERLRLDYEKACEPWLEKLANIERYSPPRPMYLVRERND